MSTSRKPMTVLECRAVDTKMSRYWKVGTFIHKYLSARLGQWIEDKVDEQWNKEYA